MSTKRIATITSYKRSKRQDLTTQADDRSSELDDDMLPEYDLSKLGHLVRGKHAEAMRQGYAVTIHHDDGLSVTHYVLPERLTDKKDDQ